MSTPETPTYDMSIHTNPDARAWANFFNSTIRELASGKNPATTTERHTAIARLVEDTDYMHVWFANAMMAMHDYLLKGHIKSETPTEEPVNLAVITATTASEMDAALAPAETPTAGQDGERKLPRIAGFNNLKAGRDALASQLAQAQRTVESVQAEYQSVVIKDGEDIKRLEGQLAQAQQELFELQGDYLKLSSTCTDATARANRLEEQLAQAQEEVKKFRSIHSGDAPDEIDQFKQQLSQAQQALEAYEDALKEAESILGMDYADFHNPMFQLACKARELKGGTQ